MKRSVLSATACCAILSATTAAAAPQPSKLEGLDYRKARQIILTYGWKPVTGSPCNTDSDTCAHFPEVSACSGVGEGYCGMAFSRQKRCLYITTSGGQPEAEGEEDTHVVAVTFRTAPCEKH